MVIPLYLKEPKEVIVTSDDENGFKVLGSSLRIS
jgi:hypothetical protein